MTEFPRAVRAIIAGAIIAGAAATSFVMVTSPWTPRMTPVLWLVVAGVFVVDLLGWVRPLILYRSNQSEAFHFDEGFLVVLILLVPPKVCMALFATVVIVSQAIRRRPLIKSAFNLGEVLFGAGAAVALARYIGPPTQPIGLRSVLGACAGAAVYFVISTSLVTLLMACWGHSWRESLSGLTSQLAVAATGTVVGALLALDIHIDRWATALAVPLLIAVRMLVSAQFKAKHDRARMQGLFDVTLDANRRLSQEAVISSVLEAAREQLRCPTAVLTGTEPEPGAMATAIELGGETQWLTVSGRLREEPFDQADRMLLDALAAIAKGALTNAELYRQVRYERGRLASVTLNIGEGVVAVDEEGNLTFVNPAAADLIRLPSRNIPIGDTLPREAMRAPEFLLAPARQVMAIGGVVREEDANFEGRDGHPIEVSYTAAAIRQNGKVVGAVISFRDISERKKLEAVMTRQALYDSLTGLANRRLLVERLDAALENSNADARRWHALIFVDVDQFKAINDSLGHGTGDGLLVAVASRMRQAVGNRGLVSRFGGDEFVILLEDIADVEEAVAVARRICTAVEEPLVLPDGYEIVASLSVGIALTEPGQTADDALRDADVAMYRAKGRGGTYQVFDKDLMGIRSSERIDLEAALRKGIDRGELELHYQPMVSVHDGRILGAEALVRWRHPVEGLMAPDRFIPMAEETGLILPIGHFVLEEACRQIAEFRRRLGRDLPVSVNLSPRQFQQSSLLTDVASALDRAGLESQLIKFEITETMVMDDMAGATEIMKKLNRLGVRLAIDDFGTGHSSLGYLKNFPVHEVKVDRIFVNHLADDPVDSAIVRAVVDLADAMGIVAVAEGVETPEQLEGLRRIGCHRAQGYLFSRPVPAEGLVRLLEREMEGAAAPEAVAAPRLPDLRVV